MKKQRRYEKLILLLELLGFAGVLFLFWLDEYADIPFRYFGALKAPPRPEEFWFEAVAILLLGIGVVVATLWVFRRIRFLEDFVRICAWCRKVEVANQWVSFEDYMKLQHDVKSTHGICPECRANASKKPAVELTSASV